MNAQRRTRYALKKLFNEIIQAPLRGNILDLGCGDGALVRVLNELDEVHAQGLDINHGVNFEADPLPYANNVFDITLMYSVIEHLHNPGNILTELKRILKKSGYLIIITSNFDPAQFLICDWKFYDDPTHVHPYNPTSLEHLLRLYQFHKRFIGLWTVPKTCYIWKLPMRWQFYIGAMLPFLGTKRFVPSFLKGKSKTMLCVFENDK